MGQRGRAATATAAHVPFCHKRAGRAVLEAAAHAVTRVLRRRDLKLVPAALGVRGALAVRRRRGRLGLPLGRAARRVRGARRDRVLGLFPVRPLAARRARVGGFHPALPGAADAHRGGRRRRRYCGFCCRWRRRGRGRRRWPQPEGSEGASAPPGPARAACHSPHVEFPAALFRRAVPRGPVALFALLAHFERTPAFRLRWAKKPTPCEPGRVPGRLPIKTSGLCAAPIPGFMRSQPPMSSHPRGLQLGRRSGMSAAIAS